LPYFAVSVPNPRAAKAVLERFAALADLKIDLDELERQAQAVEADLLRLMEQLSEAAAEASDEDEEDGDDTDQHGDSDRKSAAAETPPRLDAKAERRIESLFEKALQDRSRAFDLKQDVRQHDDRDTERSEDVVPVEGHTVTR
jgi:hypothetical protein